MNRLIYYGSVEAIPFYNCSWKPLVEWEATGVQHPWLGFPIIFLGVFFELLYIPIINIIFNTGLIKYTCYKIIIMLAIFDMTAITCSCFVTGFLLVQGGVFCTYPSLIYFDGGFGLGNWCTTCAITVSLFLNRTVSIAFKEYADVIEKRLAVVSMFLCFCYFLYIFLLTPPPIYNSYIMAWIPDPLSEEVPSAEAAAWYKNSSQAFNNWTFSVTMVVLFTIYCILVKKLARGQKSKTSRAIFIQCCLICSFNAFTAVFFNTLPFFNPAPWIAIVGQVVWSINHGVPGIIYITMNDTIRREFKKLFCSKLKHRVNEKRSSLANTNSITVTNN